MELTHFGLQDEELQQFERTSRQAIRKKQLGVIENSFESVVGHLTALMFAELEAFRLKLAHRHEETNIQQQILDIDLEFLIQQYNKDVPDLKQFQTDEKTEAMWEHLKPQLHQ